LRGAFTYLGDRRLIVRRARRTRASLYRGLPGQILDVSDEGVIVKTLDADIALMEVELEGSSCPQAAREVFSRKDIGKRLGLRADVDVMALMKRISDLEQRVFSVLEASAAQVA
jgi:hypothetical protein